MQQSVARLQCGNTSCAGQNAILTRFSPWKIIFGPRPLFALDSQKFINKDENDVRKQTENLMDIVNPEKNEAMTESCAEVFPNFQLQKRHLNAFGADGFVPTLIHIATRDGSPCFVSLFIAFADSLTVRQARARPTKIFNSHTARGARELIPSPPPRASFAPHLGWENRFFPSLPCLTHQEKLFLLLLSHFSSFYGKLSSLIHALFASSSLSLFFCLLLPFLQDIDPFVNLIGILCVTRLFIFLLPIWDCEKIQNSRFWCQRIIHAFDYQKLLVFVFTDSPEIFFPFASTFWLLSSAFWSLFRLNLWAIASQSYRWQFSAFNLLSSALYLI